MSTKEQLRSVVLETLGSPCLGSKSAYRESFPDHQVIFNASLGFENADGTIDIVWAGDIDFDIEGVTAKFEALWNKVQPRNIYVYRESTVNNHVFNGKPFPYFDWTVKLTRNPSKELSDLTIEQR